MLFNLIGDPARNKDHAFFKTMQIQDIVDALDRSDYMWVDNAIMEYTANVYSRIEDDEIQIIGASLDLDMSNLKLECETLQFLDYVSLGEPTFTIPDHEWKDLQI